VTAEEIEKHIDWLAHSQAKRIEQAREVAAYPPPYLSHSNSARGPPKVSRTAQFQKTTQQSAPKKTYHLHTTVDHQPTEAEFLNPAAEKAGWGSEKGDGSEASDLRVDEKKLELGLPREEAATPAREKSRRRNSRYKSREGKRGY
jgi:hypothetical protein